MAELLTESAPNLELPSGYNRVELLDRPATVGPDVLPWLNNPHSLSIAKCELTDGTTFYLASAIGSHSRLIDAAESMNQHEQKSTNNMFYSRLASFIQEKYSPQVESLPSPVTPFPVKVMRNKSGQRVYFGTTSLELDKSAQHPDTQTIPVVIRLGVCDKSKQGNIMSVLSGLSDRSSRRRLGSS